MERTMVVVDDAEAGAELLSEAGSVAGGVGAKLIIASVFTEEEYEQDQEALQKIARAEHTDYEERPEEFAENLGEQFAQDHLDGDVDYEVVGAVVDEDEQADRILGLAEEHDCDYIYIAGRARSPTGKALFGDRTQRVLLNFDGYVSVKMR